MNPQRLGWQAIISLRIADFLLRVPAKSRFIGIRRLERTQRGAGVWQREAPLVDADIVEKRLLLVERFHMFWATRSSPNQSSRNSMCKLPWSSRGYDWSYGIGCAMPTLPYPAGDCMMMANATEVIRVHHIEVPCAELARLKRSQLKSSQILK